MASRKKRKPNEKGYSKRRYGRAHDFGKLKRCHAEGKASYPTKDAALAGAMGILNKIRNAPNAMRVYPEDKPCEYCGGYHITSSA